ncbi:MAG: hypothetical protein HZA67_03505 [Rhodospirillales bacterium]|jgi:hypothetical protein|nr:hypothetical protein [Rhodospirillales bacterium]
MRYAIVNSGNIVVNVIELEDSEGWLPPEGHNLAAGDGNIGDSWDGTQFVAPVVAPVETTLAAVKLEAQRRILARYSFAAQHNLNMRANELNDIRFDRALSPEEETERQQLKAIAAWIKTVRAASDAIEARLAAEPYLDPAGQPDWPAA